MDEVAHEFRKNFEDKFRMLSQRIRVAEQLHAEDKDNLKKIKKRCEEVHPGIERKLKDLMSSSKADFLKLSQALDEMMKGMEHFINDFDSKEGRFLQRLSSVSDDVQVAKNWVRWTMDEMKPWKNEPSGSPFAPIDEREREQEKVMKEKVKRLEVKVNKEKSEKLRLMRGMYDCQRKIVDLERTIAEKDEGLSRLSKEKVEAIRQLCIWIEYHQSRFDQFKEMMLAKKTKNRGRS
ncbi:uncharacterized protein LOC141588798 [Silene latifolia]|uniref:uncharacterized protein LOC141588798 n=1 Tax=Silene latifolia TaxID=37657 RepID=UPI003D778893